MTGTDGSRRRSRLLAALVVVAVLVSAGAVLAVRLGDDRESTPSAGAGSASPVARADPFGDRVPVVTRTAADLPGRRLDVYVPRSESARQAATRYPVALLATDRGVPAAQYEQFAHDLASYGLVVVVTDASLLGVVDQVQAWSARVAGDPDDYLNGKVGPRVAFLVTHGDRAVPSELRSSLDAVVQVLPGAEVVEPHGSTLLVCGGRADACVAGDGLRRFTVEDATRLSATDEGVRGPRRLPTIDERRARTIAALARPTAWWLLAATGDPVGERFVAERVPPR